MIIVGNEKLLKKRLKNSELILYLFIAFVIILSFIFGLYNFSFLWIFGLICLSFLIWITRILELTDHYIAEKEFLNHRKRSLRQDESAEWLNLLLNRWWMFSEQSISDGIKNELNPYLKNNKPPYFEELLVESIFLGENTPIIEKVHVYDCLDGTKKSLSWTFESLATKLGNFATSLSHRMKIAIEAQVEIRTDQFLTMKATIGIGKWSGLEIPIQFGRFNIKGNVQIIFNFDLEVPFPHIASCSACFAQKPDLWFNVSIFHYLQISDIPLIKMFLYRSVMATITGTLVQPGKICFNFKPKFDTIIFSNIPLQKILAKGILIINIKGIYTSKSKLKTNEAYKVNEFEQMNDFRQCLISLDDQKFESNYVPASTANSWTQSGTFLIYNAKNILNIQIKRKFLLTSQILTQFDHKIDITGFSKKYIFDDKVEHKFDKYGRDENGVCLKFNMFFFPLPNAGNIIENGFHNPEEVNNIVTGVLTLCLHSARSLSSTKGNDQDWIPNPYCIIYNGGKKILNTNYVEQTKDPLWDTYLQIIVEDITKIVISFVMYDWNGNDVTSHDFLGSTQLPLTKENCNYINQSLSLSTRIMCEDEDKETNHGTIWFSLMFTPIPNLPIRIREENKCDYLKNQMLLTNCMFDAESSTSLGMVYLNILQAKDLPVLDINGYSDPYCEVFIGKKKKVPTATLR